MITMPPVQYDSVVLGGGLDLTTPTLSLKPSAMRDGVNFECVIPQGYGRIKGYERFDGRASPSDAVAVAIEVAAFTNTPSVGQTLTGGTSLATGVVAYVGALVVVVTKVVGSFDIGELVSVGATPIGTTTSVGAASSALNAAIYQNAAADIYRADITAVPGSGSVLGVAVLGGVIYAFRNNAGGTAAVLHKSTASGWSAVTMFNEISFTAGSGDILDADTLTQGGNTATIKRVVVQTGSLDAGTAAGRLIITTPAPASMAAGAATTSSGGTLTLSGAEAAITFSPDGRFEFDVVSFSGADGQRRLYGCDGVNRGFEFDGTTLVPIVTGSTPDTPMHVAGFKSHLFWGIGASIVHSAITFPYRYDVVMGAGEIATGSVVTGLLRQRGSQTAGAMVVYSRNETSVLYGTSAADWNLVQYGGETGAIRYSAQNLIEAYALDDRGVVALSTSQNFGNFDHSTLTQNIQNIITEKRTRTVASSISRDKSQYRIFFSDGYGLYLTLLNGKYLGAGLVSYPNIVNCTVNAELDDGEAVSYFGATDGFVYQFDKGTSFDGAAIAASLTLNYNTMKSPRLRKRFRKASIEVTGNAYASISFGYALGYGTTEIDQPAAVVYASSFSAAIWDSFVWDAFFWDGVSLTPTEADMTGTAENVAVTLVSGTDYIDAYVINSIIMHYTPRRGVR